MKKPTEPRYFSSIKEYEKWWEEELNKAQKQNEKELPPIEMPARKKHENQSGR
jgi:hypothetical protein